MKLNKLKPYLGITKKTKTNNLDKRKKLQAKIDPHHCRCFSIPKIQFRYFVSQIQNYGFSEPFFEDDHKQIVGFTKRLSQYSQIHVKLMRTGRIEAEIEPPQDYPIAHLNSIHSYSAHPELNVLFTTMQISYKCKKNPPPTCIHRQIILPQNPTHRDTFLVAGGLGVVLDLFLNDGKFTGTALNILSKQVKKTLKRKANRRKYLYRTY
jgi:hypothetical protein